MTEWFNPYPEAPSWFRGNIHTHTTASDGKDEPQEVVNWYSSRRYDFLVITDHNLRLDISELDGQGMLIVPGEELTAAKSHLLGLGIRQKLPRGENLQRQVDLVNADGGLAVVCHPNWMGLTVEDIGSLRGYLGIEISNCVCYRLNGKGDSVEWWDALLSAGHHCWGFASDDCHDLGTDAGRCWIQVAARVLHWNELATALTNGSFFATEGPRFESFHLQGDTLKVATDPCRQLRFVGRDARILDEVNGDEGRPLNGGELTLPDSEPFVRVEIVGFSGRRAWSQPFWQK